MFVLLFVEFYHPHHLIPPKIDHLYSNPFMFAGFEGEGAGGAHLFEGFGIYLGFEGALEFVPCFGVTGEKGLADVEGHAVVIGVQEPGGHILAPGGMDLPRERVVDVYTPQLHHIGAIFLLFYAHIRLTEDGEDLAGTGGFEEITHEHIRGDVGEVDAETWDKLTRFLDKGLGLGLDAEARKDEYLVGV